MSSRNASSDPIFRFSTPLFPSLFWLRLLSTAVASRSSQPPPSFLHATRSWRFLLAGADEYCPILATGYLLLPRKLLLHLSQMHVHPFQGSSWSHPGVQSPYNFGSVHASTTIAISKSRTHSLLPRSLSNTSLSAPRRPSPSWMVCREVLTSKADRNIPCNSSPSTTGREGCTVRLSTCVRGTSGMRLIYQQSTSDGR